MADCTPSYVAPERRVPPLTPTQRFRILERDGHTCRYCGASAPDVELHVDHVVPRSQGGTNDDANLVAACATCNIGKSDKPWTDWKSEATSASVAASVRQVELETIADRGRAMRLAHVWANDESEYREQMAGVTTANAVVEAWRYPWNHGNYVDLRLRDAGIVVGVGVMVLDDGEVHVEIIGGADVHICRHALTGDVDDDGLRQFKVTARMTLPDARPQELR